MEFQINFPLRLNFNKHSHIEFNLINNNQKGSKLHFNKGFYYLEGENGSGKSSFLSMLALLSGDIGKKSKGHNGSIQFNNTNYNDLKFNYLKAAVIREQNFCIFTQEVFFLPGITSRKMYSVLNSSNENSLNIYKDIPKSERPNFLSGGQQQSRYMDIVFKKKKPVWFLDEPFNNMDNRNKIKFWEIIKNVNNISSKIFFLIDHGLNKIVKNNEHFEVYNKIISSTNNNEQVEKYNITIYKLINPDLFIENEILNYKDI